MSWMTVRYALGGAILAVAASGTVGIDSLVPDTLSAVVGGGFGALAAKTLILA